MFIDLFYSACVPGMRVQELDAQDGLGTGLYIRMLAEARTRCEAEDVRAYVMCSIPV